MTIVVTGASGKVGRLLASNLAARGVHQRLVVRDARRAPILPDADVVVADFYDAASIRRAINPGDRVFMVSVHEGVEARIQAHASFIDAAAGAGAGLVAYLSMVNASRQSAFPHSWSHRATEELLEASGVPWVFLRMNLFLDDLPLWFDADGTCRGPAGDGRVALVTRGDVAAVAAEVLGHGGHERRILDVSGAEAHSVAELAAVCSASTGRVLRYEPAPAPVYVAARLALGRHRWDAEAGAGSYLAVAAGELAQPSDTVLRVTGREATGVQAWVDANCDAFARTGDRAAARGG